MTYLYLDIETRSELDLTKVGTAAYGEHPSTEVLCIAWAVDDGPVNVAKGEKPDGALALYQTAEFEQAVSDPGLTIVAHNVAFERDVLKLHGCNWLDTAALAARMGLPRKLEELSKFFWPDDPAFQKDMEGNRIMLQICKERRPSAKNPNRWWTPEHAPEKFAKLYAYCMRDVEVMREIHRRLLPLEPFEHRVWALTEKMNARGVKIDVASIAPAQAHLAKHSAPLEREFVSLVGCSHRSPLKAKALGLENAEKDTVRKALKDESLPADKRRALELLQTLNKSSLAKLEAMKLRMTSDGRLHGAFAYCGAERTGRWSSMGVQFQNLVQGFGEMTDLAFEALHAGVVSEMFLGDPQPHPKPPLDELGIISMMMRGFLVGPFLVGDFAQIEARTLAWLAGQQDLIAAFRDKADPYCMMASRVYGRTVTKKDKAERFMGKQVVLGAGYGLGFRGFQALLDKTYDVQIEEAFAKKVISVYRAANKAIVAFWDKLERGFRFVVQNRSKRVQVQSGTGVPLYMGTIEHGGVPYAWIELPSGRKLYYARPEVKPNGELRYFGRDIKQGGKWQRVGTYGGKLAENCWSGDTLVLTSEGPVPIAQVRPGAFVWDGVEWVRTAGAKCQGEQEVGEWLGARVTPNHLILDGCSWTPVIRLGESASRRCLSQGHALAALSYYTPCPGSTGKLDAPAIAGASGQVQRVSCEEDERRAAGNADGRTRADCEPTPRSQPSSLTPTCAPSGDTATAASCPDAMTPTTSRSPATAEEESSCTRRGGRTGSPSSSTSERSMAGTTSRSTSTASTTTAGMCRETCGCALEAKTPTTEAARESCDMKDGSGVCGCSCGASAPSGPPAPSTTTWETGERPSGSWRATGQRIPVWDLLDCGPRARFTVLTPAGPVIAHNCTQAVSRDILAHAMLALDEAGFPLVLTVHDEVVCEACTGGLTLEDFEQTLTRTPAWAKGLPVEAEVFESRRYRK